MNETWIYHYIPETKNQSKQGIGPGEPAPKKQKTVQLAGKVMASVFWDPKGILLTDYLQLQHTFGEAENRNSGKRPGMTKKKMLFHHDKARVHSSAVAPK
jgi:hypothetical protein